VKAELLERRQECVTLKAKGFPLPYIVKQMSEKYHVTPQAVYRDWQIRGKWLKALLQIKNPETFFYDCLARHEEIYKQALVERMEADNSNAKIGALNLMRHINRDFVEMVVLHGVMDDIEMIKEKIGVRGKAKLFAGVSEPDINKRVEA